MRRRQLARKRARLDTSVVVWDPITARPLKRVVFRGRKVTTTVTMDDGRALCIGFDDGKVFVLSRLADDVDASSECANPAAQYCIVGAYC